MVWLALSFPHLLAKSTNNLGHPILSLHSPAIVKVFRMVGLVCPSPHLLAKSTNNLGHPILSLHSPAIVKVFRMVGWSVLPP
ncbi:hypothetical protein GBAR_LOCUS19066, partial [Geodia barretti]